MKRGAKRWPTNISVDLKKLDGTENNISINDFLRLNKTVSLEDSRVSVGAVELHVIKEQNRFVEDQRNAFLRSGLYPSLIAPVFGEAVLL